MALHEIGLQEGDEVIVPALTFVATVNPVVYVGAIPIFVDVDKHTWNMDPKCLRKKITKKTKAIIPVHLYGNPCCMDEIMSISKEFGLHVIEDATESLGARYKGKHTGTIGDFGCFSFNGNKVITTGRSRQKRSVRMIGHGPNISISNVSTPSAHVHIQDKYPVIIRS